MAEVTFTDWTERFKVYNDYIRALAEYKLKDAEAKLKIAQAGLVWFEVRKQQVVLNQLQRDLRIFNRANDSLNREAKQMEDRAKKVLLLLRGTAIEASSYSTSWGAYTWFESRALVETNGGDLFKIKVTAAARTESNFVAVRKNDSTVTAAPTDVSNGLELMDWMNVQRYIAKRGSDAQEIAREVVSRINAVATTSVTELRQRISEMKKGTYDAWKLSAILGVSDNPAAKRIEQTGAK